MDNLNAHTIRSDVTDGRSDDKAVRPGSQRCEGCTGEGCSRVSDIVEQMAFPVAPAAPG